MKLSKLGLLCVAMMTVPLASCGGGNNEPDNTVDVFVLSGQSNMEGSTFFCKVRSFAENLRGKSKCILAENGWIL